MSAVLAAAYALMLVLLLGTLRYRRFLLGAARASGEPGYAPRVALLVAVRGTDPGFREHLEALFAFDYPSYDVIFGVADCEDAAYPELEDTCRRHPGRARLVVAGHSLRCSGKIHNLLACYEVVPREAEVVVVVDADVAVHPTFLRRLVAPLREPDVGASTGYRWLVAAEPTLARTVACLTNAAGAVSFWISGNVWGGAVALRRSTFDELSVAAVWGRAVSDDLTLRSLLKRHGLRVVSVPEALLVSQQEYTWRSYWDFLVRQLVIARVYAPVLWWQVVTLYVLTAGAMLQGVAGGAAWLLGAGGAAPLAALPILGLYVVQGGLAIDAAETALLRRGERFPRLPRSSLLLYPLAVLVGCCQVLVSATRRWIEWRGIVYRMHAPDHTEVILGRAAAPAERPQAPE